MPAYTTKLMGQTCIVVAATSGEARSMTFRAAREAGWPVKFLEVRASRAYRFDSLISSRVMSVEQAEEALKQ